MTGPDAVPVRRAATVVLLRDTAGGVETWLLTRVPQLEFAPGMSVFPGGRVDPDDAALPFLAVDWVERAARLGVDEHEARALVGAAARELFEETGVLLAATAPAADPGDVEAGRARFADALAGAPLDAAVLAPWARWVTPAGEVRRYDTFFFVCALPAGARPADLTSESSSAGWVTPAAALAAAERGERLLLPPTATTLADLARFASVAEALEAAPARDLAAVRPTLHRLADGGVEAELPDGRRLTLGTADILGAPGGGR